MIFTIVSIKLPQLQILNKPHHTQYMGNLDVYCMLFIVFVDSREMAA